MTKNFLLFFILTPLLLIAQLPFNTATKAEWDELDKTFIAFFQALESKNKAAFMAMSRQRVDCSDCITSTESESEGYFVPAEVFFQTITKNFKESPVYKALVKRGYSFRIMEVKRPNERNPNAKLKIYEVWVDTYLAGEWSKGHPGTIHSFQFVKINGKFTFYGLTSLP